MAPWPLTGRSRPQDGPLAADRPLARTTMPNRFLIIRIGLIVGLCCTLFQAQEIQPDHRARVDAAVPRKAPAKAKQPRRMLVTNLSIRDGKPVRGSSAAAIPVGNYAIQQMGTVTGAYEAIFND